MLPCLLQAPIDLQEGLVALLREEIEVGPGKSSAVIHAHVIVSEYLGRPVERGLGYYKDQIAALAQW